MNRSDIEIMAPAGSWESIMAAIQGGADSIYFGVEQLNMRARSSRNFTINDLPAIAALCREHTIKSYLTLNVVIYDHEIKTAKTIIDAAVSARIDAIIASDISVIKYAAERKMSIHLSTQVNITNIESLQFYSQWADVVVLARELNLNQISDIYNAIKSRNIIGPSGYPMKIELFAHGALCMAISGKCYLSLHENNASANRGNCYQTCRKAYIVTEKEGGNELEIENEYIMSPKDLCTIGFVNKLLDAGVRVLKIEGRARGPEYVKTVSRAYRIAVEAVISGNYTSELIEELKNKCASVFNRGFWDGYYLGQKLGEWSSNYGSAATKRKIYIGKITNYYSNLGVAEIKLETGPLKRGESLMITGSTTGVVEFSADEIRLEKDGVEMAPKGSVCSIVVPELVRRSDRLFKISDASEIIKQ